MNLTLLQPHAQSYHTVELDIIKVFMSIVSTITLFSTFPEGNYTLLLDHTLSLYIDKLDMYTLYAF